MTLLTELFMSGKLNLCCFQFYAGTCLYDGHFMDHNFLVLIKTCPKSNVLKLLHKMHVSGTNYLVTF